MPAVGPGSVLPASTNWLVSLSGCGAREPSGKTCAHSGAGEGFSDVSVVVGADVADAEVVAEAVDVGDGGGGGIGEEVAKDGIPAGGGGAGVPPGPSMDVPVIAEVPSTLCRRFWLWELPTNCPFGPT